MSRLLFLALLVLSHVLLANAGTVTTKFKLEFQVGRIKYKCNFILKHTDERVYRGGSKMTCKPNKWSRSVVDVEYETDNYKFIGQVKAPKTIVSMEVLTTSRVVEMEFKEMYANVSSQIRNEYKHTCGIDTLEANMRMSRTRSWTNMDDTEFWANARINWNFVSTGDSYAQYAITTDADLGLTKDDVDTVIAAMRQIEEKTCIEFRRVAPTRGQPWLLVSRDARQSDLSCQLEKVKSLINTNIAGLGKIYNRLQWSDKCFKGAYAWYGSASPQNFVISQTRVSNDNQNDIGLVIHELLHNLGLGHTQKRQDADQHIEIQWNNIKADSRSQYEPCIEANDPRCRRYNDYGTDYDCSSIMHYLDYFFLTPQARATGGKTMIANTDITLLNKMYCADQSVEQNYLVASPNYPE